MENLTKKEKEKIEIALFMDYKHEGETLLTMLNGKPNIDVDSLEYDTSWDWLMPVVEKIETINLDADTNFANVTIGTSKYCIIQDSNSNLFEFIGEEETKLESVYKVVIQFIEWYNENK